MPEDWAGPTMSVISSLFSSGSWQGASFTSRERQMEPTLPDMVVDQGSLLVFETESATPNRSLARNKENSGLHAK